MTCIGKSDMAMNIQVLHQQTELGSGTALQKKNLIVIRNIEKAPDALLCTLCNAYEFRASVTHLKHRKSMPLPIQKLIAQLLQNHLW